MIVTIVLEFIITICW